MELYIKKKKKRKMCNIIIRYIIFIIFYYSLYSNGYAKQFTIKNKDSNFQNLDNFINFNQEKNGLIMNFVDDYYDFSLLPYTMDISVVSNITFIGNSKGTTTFDYHNNKRGRLIFTYSNYKDKNQIVKFENINFVNFDPLNAGDTEMIIIQANSDHFYFVVNNCNIQNNAYRFLRLDYKCNKPSHNNTSVLIKNTNFT